MDNVLTIDVFSDVVCPWCYIGEKRLELALAERPDVRAEIRWRPFQLRPDAPAEGQDWEEFAREKFGGAARAQAMFAQVAEVGREVGIKFNFERVASSPNTADAHRLLVLAGEAGGQWALATALFKAYFSDGADLNDRRQLLDIAESAGLERAAAERCLDGGLYADEVARSQASAEQIGVGGVPFYIFAERFAVSGAQPVGVFLRALEAATE